MNNKLPIVIGAVAGLGVGGATGYFLAKKLYFESKLKDELAALQEYIEADYGGVPEENIIASKENDSDSVSPLSGYYKNFEANKVDYTKPESIEVEDFEEEEETDDALPVGEHHEFGEEDEEETGSSSFSTLPRPISEIDYCAIDGYSCVELGCTDGHVLFDEDGDQLSPSDVDRFVGLDFASYLEDGEDILYMRNDLYETDYKIVFDLDSNI